jgi:methylenetetrahydrofolate reductase (NADPH)
MRGFSLELAPTSLLKGGAILRLLPSVPAGTRVYLPALPADPPDAIERSIALLRRTHTGLVPVPHIPAQRVPSLDALERQLTAWQRSAADGALHEALVVRGDANGHSTDVAAVAPASVHASPVFAESLELLETNVLQRHGFDTVSLCGHPEGVGPLSPAQAREALVRKLHWAAAAGVASRVVTQFCFDAAMTTQFVDALRGSAGAATPVSLGIVGPSATALRVRMAHRCGVAPPLNTSRAASSSAPSAAAEDDCWPADYMDSLRHWQVVRGSDAGVSLHISPFGGLHRTLEWLDSLSDDDI